MKYEEKFRNFCIEVDKDCNWVLKVIDSCRTQQHFRNVRNLTNNFFSKWMNRIGRLEFAKEKYVFALYNHLISIEMLAMKQLNIKDYGEL